MKIHQILINDTNKLPNKFPKFHNLCYKQIKKLYPNEEYHLYSGEEIEKIIKNNFHNDVFVAYKKLKPYAYKADLARLCLLYLYGGLYVDLNLYFINTIPNLHEVEFFAFRDISEMSKQSWSVLNGVIYSFSKSKIIKNAIDLIVKHCKKEYYGFQCIGVSGPLVLGIAIVKSLPHHGATNGKMDNFIIKSFNEKTQNEIKKIEYISDKFLGLIMDYEDKLIAITKPSKGGDIESLGFIGTNNYFKMWKNRDVYDTSIKFNKNLTFVYK